MPPAAGAIAAFGTLVAGVPAPGSGPAAAGSSLTHLQIARLLAGHRISLGNRRVAALVHSLQGCLGRLPERLRTVLRLRTGIHEPRRLSARTVAARLHISRKRLALLETRAVRLLASQARAHGCARSAATAAPPRFLPADFIVASPTGVAGGVAGALYLKAPAEQGAEAVPPADALPSVPLRVTPKSSNPLFWEALVAALLGALLVAHLVRVDFGLGPVRLRRRRRSAGKRDDTGRRDRSGKL